MVVLVMLGALGSNSATLTPAWDFSDPNCKDSKMNTGYFEQISDCWSSELRPATYYRTVAAQARRLQADATTPSVRQYLDKMIAHCEQMAGQVEPGVALSRSGTRRSRGFTIRPRSAIAAIAPGEVLATQ